MKTTKVEPVSNEIIASLQKVYGSTNYYQVVDDSDIPLETTITTSSSGDATVTFQTLLDSIAGERPIKIMSQLPEIYGKICLHHNDEERKNLECPVCLKRQLIQAYQMIQGLQEKLDAALDTIRMLNIFMKSGRQLGKTELTEELLRKHRERWRTEYNKHING